MPPRAATRSRWWRRPTTRPALVAVEQARPRRAALPAELRPRARPRGAARAPDQRRARAAPGAAAADGRARLRRRAAGPPARAGAQHVRRDGGRPAAALAARRRRIRDRNLEDADWSPARHRVIGGERGRRAAARAGRPRAHRRLPLLRLPDRRRAAGADRARRGRALRRRVRQRARGDRAGGGGRPRPRRRGARRRDGREFTIAGEKVVNATGVWADRIRPDELHDEAEVPVIRPSRGTHIILPRERLPVNVGAIVPAAGGRRIFVLPWLGQTLIGTTDNDYEGDIEHVRPADEDVAYLLEAVNAFFATDLVPERHRGRLRGRAAADLHRRPQEVGRHLAQGRAVRDLERHGHDHRRQAHDLAADGEDDGRPAGRARRPRGALPHRRDPARDAGRRERAARVEGVAEAPTSSSPAATASRPTTC